MQLDTHVKGLLDTLAASAQPKMWELPPTEARKMALGLTQMVEGKEPIGELENGSLPGPSGPLPFRIYIPVAVAAEPLPCIVYFHGGAWIFGNLDTHDCMCRMLANESGCRVVSIDYRLAPENRFPAGLEDAYAATEWVATNASKIGIDPTRIAVAGDFSRWQSRRCSLPTREDGRTKACLASSVLPGRGFRRRQPVAP